MIIDEKCEIIGSNFEEHLKVIDFGYAITFNLANQHDLDEFKERRKEDLDGLVLLQVGLTEYLI
jgi:hypothetical protein